MKESKSRTKARNQNETYLGTLGLLKANKKSPLLLHEGLITYAAVP